MRNILLTILMTSIIMIIMVALTVIIYYLVTRPSINRQKKHFEQLHLNLKPGMYVEFANGLRGRIETVNEEECDIRVKSGGVITVSRYAITREIEK